MWLLASTPLDTTTAEKLKELGPVSWIVSPDREHHMFLQEYKEAYPEAKTVGCEGLLPMESQKGFKFDCEHGHLLPVHRQHELTRPPADIYGRDECPFAKLLSDQIKAEPFGKSHVNEVHMWHGHVVSSRALTTNVVICTGHRVPAHSLADAHRGRLAPEPAREGAVQQVKGVRLVFHGEPPLAWLMAAQEARGRHDDQGQGVRPSPWLSRALV